MTIPGPNLGKKSLRPVEARIEAGNPGETLGRGQTREIAADEPAGKLAKLEPHPESITGDPEELVHMDWASKATRPL